MTDHIRKLLGGYATNTLTEAERKALFEAALDDQELFDALQQEQALKDLLTDPISREQIQRALEKPSAAAAWGTRWWTRWWAWTGAAGAVAAAVLIVAVTQTHAPEPARQMAALDARKPSAAAPLPEKIETDSAAKSAPTARPRLTKDSKALRLPSPLRARPAGGAVGGSNEMKFEARSAPAPATPAEAQTQAPAPAPAPAAVPVQNRSDLQQSNQAVAPVANSLRDQEQVQVRAARVGGAIGASLAQGNAVPVIFTVLKRDDAGAYQPIAPDAGLQPGDAVRLTVAPAKSGYLVLSRQAASGEWTRLYPAGGPGLAVNANASYTIPDAPIGVTDTDQKLRITLLPGPLLSTDSFGAAKAKTAPLKKQSAASPPSYVELTIGPKKAP